MEKNIEGISAVIRIAVTGPESTGKSQLCEQLAEHYHAVLVEEYAREYLEGLSRDYTREDVIAIAREQYRRIMDAVQGKTAVMIADTELLVTSIWITHRYGQPDPWMEAMLQKQPFDLYLLCDVDLPWQEDPLREHPHLRDYFFQLYHRRLKEMNVRFRIVKGIGEERFQNALSFIDQSMRQSW